MSESETNKPKISQKSSKTKGFYYSFLTLVLLFCLIQIGFGAILNISKTIAYRAKILTLTKIRDAAEAKNQGLKQDIELFSATSSLEGIARNPQSEGSVSKYMFIGAGLAEAMGLFGLVLALLLMFA